MTALRAGIIGAACLLLTACGVHPGAAAVVGDESISAQSVQNFANGFCQFSAQPGRPAVPKNLLLGQTVNQLVLTDLQDQFAAGQGVTYDRSAYSEGMAVVESRINQIEPGLREEFTEQVRRIIKAELTQRALGARSLKAQGIGNPDASAAAAEGAKLLEAWRLKSGIKVSIDPRYNPGASGQAGAGDGSLSKRVSEIARLAVEGTDTGYVGSLPAAQVCSSPK